MSIAELETKLLHLKGIHADTIAERILWNYGYCECNGKNLDKKKLKGAMFRANHIHNFPPRKTEYILRSEDINYILK